MKNVLVVDCNDSFVYNLVQLLRESRGCAYRIVNVNAIPFERLSDFSHILLSPGPGVPNDYPSLFRLLEQTKATHRLLGVCLGMQAIAQYFGCQLKQLDFPKHGHESNLRIMSFTDLFRNIPQQSVIGRYHSWIVNADSLTAAIQPLAWDDEQQLMALRHTSFQIYGVQFHPESIITQHGAKMIENWLNG